VYGNLLPASIIHQYEIGAKHYFLDQRISSSFSLYRIINDHLAQQAIYKADGSTPNTDATVKSISGETTSDGFEFGLTGNLSRNLYFISGYGYNHIRFTNASGKFGSNINGEQLVNAPNHTANFSLFYTFEEHRLKGLKIGITGFYTGKDWVDTTTRLAKASPAAGSLNYLILQQWIFHSDTDIRKQGYNARPPIFLTASIIWCMTITASTRLRPDNS